MMKYLYVDITFDAIKHNHFLSMFIMI